jgi:CO/xanthine dehydrogenase Mo-binding subunit
MTRSEDMAASNPAGAEMMTVELGADAEGNLTGIRTRILVDRGSTDDFGVESIAALLSAGPYRWQAHQLTALGVATNRMTFGAYRAPTAPPAAFAVESLIDELAHRLEMDPLDLRLRNVVGEGDANPAGQPFPIFGARQCLERIREHPLWSRRQDLPDGEGIGAAIGWWPGGYEPAAAVCRLDADGNLTIITGAADMSGVESGFATIAAERSASTQSAFASSAPTPRAPRMPAPAAAARSPTPWDEPSNARRARRASDFWRSRPRSSRSRPRTWRSSTARYSRRACPRRRCRSTSWRPRS